MDLESAPEKDELVVVLRNPVATPLTLIVHAHAGLR
jgi:hypothetical protein